MSTNQELYEHYLKMGLIEKDGWCYNGERDTSECFKAFKAFWDQNPKAALQLHVRNFNNLGSDRVEGGAFNGSVMLLLPDIKVWVFEGRVYFHNPRLQDLFSQKLYQFLEKLEKEGEGSISAHDFYRNGSKIAVLLKRPLILLHQIGGDPQDAEYHVYNFYPSGNWRRFLPVKRFQPAIFGPITLDEALNSLFKSKPKPKIRKGEK
jgi:hypothetical protein